MRKKTNNSQFKFYKQIVLLVLAVISALFGWNYQKTSGQSANEFDGKVVAVSDGDTIRVLTSANQEIKIRFAFIDAPEKKQAFGMKSKQSLSDLIYGRMVDVRVTDTDRYGRKVAVIRLPESAGGLDINLEQVKRGLAWHYTQYAKKSQSKEDFEQYEVAQEKAQAARTGLWSDVEPQAPWEFRRQK
ncbi:thermonuclease family protein [Leeia sp. TBRC 13508]|uniref:Thermonuclease family protein n=1 Tax=Leeia speluncae TaxID=2884804 RepID=A0ABS8D2L3_9NEIS|nr:thermonuclease family protein [Leeia speluncae]MCB6182419.1 thermonuclease family protein [Leeia speluncae]